MYDFIEIKKCYKCNCYKELKLLVKDKRMKDGYRSTCKECKNNQQRKYYLDNKETYKNKYRKYDVDWSKEYRNNNIEKIKKYEMNYRLKNKDKLAKYKKDNKEKISKYNKKWRKENPDKNTAKEAKRRAKKLKATPKWADLDKIMVLYEKAKWLESITGLKYEVDHIIPLQNKKVCGLHVWENLQILEASLNRQKNNRIL